MLSVSVHKDIGEYTEKVVGKLSARTLLCTAGALCASVGAAAVCNLGLGIAVEDAALPVMAASMPFWLLGFWRPKGMTAERFLPLLAEHALTSGKLAYSTGAHLNEIAGSVACEKVDRRAARKAKRKGAERHGAKDER